MILTFKGHSDDVFFFGVDEDDDCGNGTMRIAEVDDGEYKMWVHAQYGKGMGGVWMLGLSAPDGQKEPPWKIHWKFSDYSPTLCLEVPDDTTVEIVSRR